MTYNDNKAEDLNVEKLNSLKDEAYNIQNKIKDDKDTAKESVSETNT